MATIEAERLIRFEEADDIFLSMAAEDGCFGSHVVMEAMEAGGDEVGSSNPTRILVGRVMVAIVEVVLLHLIVVKCGASSRSSTQFG